MQAWNCINEEAEKMQQTSEKGKVGRNDGSCNSLNDDIGRNCKQRTSESNCEKVNGKNEVEKNGIYENGSNNPEQVRDTLDHLFVMKLVCCA